MEFVNILSLEGIGTTKDKINFNKAISANDNEGFSLSGSKLLLSFLRSKLGRVPMLIDFSAVPSSLKNDNKLADFITVFDPTSKFVEKEKLDYSYNKVYCSLRDKYLGVFYHPKFFDSPEKPVFYFSKYDISPLGNYDNDQKDNNNDQKDNNIVPEPWFTIDENDYVYFKNKSFSISYEGYKEKSEKTSNKKINIQKRNDILLKFYSKYFLRDVSNDEKNCYLISIPLIGYPGRETESNIYEGLGAIFVFFIKENFDESIFDIDLLGNQLWFLGLQITYNSIFQIAKELADKVQKEATKSAKSAIMSRNMSHNLGSHVMSYLKQHLSSVATMLQDNVVTHLFDSAGNFDKLLEYLQNNVPEFVNNNDNDYKELSGLSSQDIINARLALPFLVGLGHFVSYLQERQDFIATIATDYIPYYATVNFKDSVYDELNPDKRYERHPDRINQKLDNILLGNIARSEGLGRSTSPTQQTGGKLCDIILRYKDFDGNTCKKGSKAYNSLEELRQFNISLPGGIVGRQAIFSIVENVIRNAAKHGSWRGTGKLELTFNKYDPLVDDIPNDDNLERQMSLREVVDTYYSPTVDINDLYIITLTDNTICTNDTLDKIQSALNDDYVDSFGIMKDANKGIKEMRISAAWLRAIFDEAGCVNPFNDVSAEYIRKNKLRAPILYARLAQNIQNKTNLQYIFCLPKPKVLAVISKYLAEECKNIHINGCKFYTEKDFKAEFNKSYEFIICGNSRYNRIRPFSSSRTFTFSNIGIARDEFKSLVGIESLSKLLSRMYEKMSDVQETDIINIDDKKVYIKFQNLKNENKKTAPLVQKISVNDNDVIIDDHLTCEKKDLHVADFSLGNYYRIGNVFVSDGKICGQYIYRRHHDAISQFNEFMDSKVRTEFVESVTGSNSTDRLIRNEDIDNPWFYRHLHAMKMKVAIFDERLFSKITGLEEMDFTKGKLKSATGENFKEIKNYYIDLFPEKKTLINAFDNPKDLNIYINLVYEKKLQVSENYSKGLMAASYIQKQIYVYTIIQDVEKPSKFYLIGVSLQDNLPKYRDELNHNYGCLCARLAELTWTKEEGLDIKYLCGGEYIDKFFNYLSIHQGLLDKLYESFGIKDVDDKHKLTEKLYNHFIKVQEIIPVELDTRSKTIKCSYLSGMMIHSGRSKPGIEDMPQMLPFIQYAAMEHAVMDCKYSLVSLLENARYEQ